jgi:hypothetical protein
LNARSTREAYLARIEQAKTETVHRSELACGNWRTVLLPASQMIKRR